MEDEPEPVPTVFLESKIISQPILYSIVGAKTLPLHKKQSIPVKTEVPLPIFYTVTGQPHRPVTPSNASTTHVTTAVVDRSATLYPSVGNPRLHVQIQEPMKQVPQQSSVSKPVQTTSKLPKQPSPTLYPVVGHPTLASATVPSNRSDSPPLTQPTAASSIQPIPILYTVVGETQVPNDISKENRSPVGPIKSHRTDASLYTVIGNPSIPQSPTIPNRVQPLQPLKQQQTQSPALYPVIGKPTLPSEEDRVVQPKYERYDMKIKMMNIHFVSRPSVRKKTPPRTIVPTRRMSRSLDRQTAPEPETEPITSMPPLKNKRLPKLKKGLLHYRTCFRIKVSLIDLFRTHNSQIRNHIFPSS